MYMCVCVCVYIYIYRERERERGGHPTLNNRMFLSHASEFLPQGYFFN